MRKHIIKTVARIAAAFALAGCVTLLGCASHRSAVRAKKSDSPEAVVRVRQQIESLRGYTEVISTERIRLDDGKTGWLITYRQTDQTFGGPCTSTKWMKLGSEGYVAGMSPESY
jgi:hypothetical protein